MIHIVDLMQRPEAQRLANHDYNASSDNAVAVAGSTSTFEINLVAGLFRDRGREDGSESVHL